MRTWSLFVGAAIVALLSVWALAHVLPERYPVVVQVLYGLVIIGVALGSRLVRNRLARIRRTDEPDSVERELGVRAGSDSYSGVLVLLAAFGTYLVFMNQFVAALGAYVVLTLSVILFWIRYATLRRRLTQGA